MKKIQKKKVVHAKTKSSKNLAKKTKYNRGALGAGTAYAILAMLVVAAAGSMMIGNIAPKGHSPETGQRVIITTNTPEPAKSRLQLYYFPGATYTPTPSPTIPPQPDVNRGGGSGGGNNRGGGPGPGGSSSCFIAGTKVLMSDNSQKNIEDVKVGDQVMGYNEKNNKTVSQTVLEIESPVRDHYYSVTLSDGTVLGMTDEHPLYTSNGWEAIAPENTAKENAALKVGKLTLGDKVLKDSGEYATVVSLNKKTGSVQTYNLKKVSGYNDFFANGVAAHNKGSGGGGNPGGGGGTSGGGAR